MYDVKNTNKHCIYGGQHINYGGSSTAQWMDKASVRLHLMCVYLCEGEKKKVCDYFERESDCCLNE